MNVDDAACALQELGFVARYLARGMESLVFDVGAGLLAKVWFSRRLDDVRPLQRFYHEFRNQQLPYLTPLMRQVVQTRTGNTVSIEDRLPGTPLRDLLRAAPTDLDLQRGALALFASVVNELSSIPSVPTSKRLPVIDEPVPSNLIG